MVLNLMNDKAVALWVAEAEGRLLGFVYVLVKDPLKIPVMAPRRYAVVDSVCVTAEARRQGIGRRLMEHADAWAVAQGATSVELSVYEFNDPALALYRDLGYETLSRKLSKPLGERR